MGALIPVTAPATDAARRWNGWGTALKPASEHWTLARKPLIGTVAENVLMHGTGALNIDECRITTDDTLVRKLGKSTTSASGWTSTKRSAVAGKDGGRWPANLVLDEEAATMLDEQSGAVDGASRFFYVAKSSQREKNAGLPDGLENNHPTVKSLALMRWLVKLITPPGGVVLDPFAGSGSTGCATLQEGFRFVGIERDAGSCQIAAARLTYWAKGTL